MCELFGVNSAKKIPVNNWLKEFFSHSEAHPHGWGLAIFHEGVASVEKEPAKACYSKYLRERLRSKLEASDLIAHIRLATVGSLDYENCHPFSKKDNCGRRWTLAHNGTMFDCPVLHSYFYKQEGQTDSERLLYYFVDEINEKQEELGRSLALKERFDLLDRLLGDITVGNKVNLLFYDGEVMYVHTNYADSLYYLSFGDTVLFSTVPLDRQNWKKVPFTTLLAWKDGKLLYQGTNHKHEYVENAKDMEYLFLDSSLL